MLLSNFVPVRRATRYADDHDVGSLFCVRRRIGRLQEVRSSGTWKYVQGSAHIRHGSVERRIGADRRPQFSYPPTHTTKTCRVFFNALAGEMRHHFITSRAFLSYPAHLLGRETGLATSGPTSTHPPLDLSSRGFFSSVGGIYLSTCMQLVSRERRLRFRRMERHSCIKVELALLCTSGVPCA